MKKILAFTIALLLLIYTFPVVTAATHFIGGADGVATFSPTDTSVNVNIGFTVAHKYAVDINYGEMTLNVGNLTWNVKTHKYDFGGGVTPANPTYNITVVNHSDMPVYAKGVVTKNEASPMQNTGTMFDVTMTAPTVTVPKVLPNAQSASTATLALQVTSNNYATLINQIIQNMGGTVADSGFTAKLATVAVTVQQDPFPVGP